ncbi:hypothetical protein ETW24_11050 [Leisingera sp. NJS204]|nr:hypothetical protein ETW24_11050 [Leisingera sp. NJS204]
MKLLPNPKQGQNTAAPPVFRSLSKLPLGKWCGIDFNPCRLQSLFLNAAGMPDRSFESGGLCGRSSQPCGKVNNAEEFIQSTGICPLTGLPLMQEQPLQPALHRQFGHA